MAARTFAPAVVALALALAAFASPLASRHPDGLERVAADQGFAGRAMHREPPTGALSTEGGGVLGTVTVLVAGGALAAVMRRRTRRG